MMRRDFEPGLFVGYIAVAVVCFAATTARAQQEQAVVAAVQYLKTHPGRSSGESAMIALALMKADVPHNDPIVQNCMSQIRAGLQAAGNIRLGWGMARAPTRPALQSWRWTPRTPRPTVA